MQHTQSETEQHFSNILLPEFPRLQVQGLRIRGGVGADTGPDKREVFAIGRCHEYPRVCPSWIWPKWDTFHGVMLAGNAQRLVEAWVTQRAGGTGRRCEDLRQRASAACRASL